MKRLALSIVCVVAVLCAIAFGARSWWSQFINAPHPTDSILEARFHQHEAEFDGLVDMSHADLKVVRITSDFTWLEHNSAWPRPESELGFSKERWNQYRALFKVLGLDGGILQETGGRVTYLISSASGLATHSTMKGYAYSMDELSPTAASLDKATSSMPQGHAVVFKKLKNHWYLFYMSA